MSKAEKQSKHFDELYTSKYHILAERILAEVIEGQGEKGEPTAHSIIENKTGVNPLDFLPLFREALQESLAAAQEIFGQIGLMPPSVNDLRRESLDINWQDFVETYNYLQHEKQMPKILFIPQAAIDIDEWEVMFRSAFSVRLLSRFVIGVDSKTLNPTSGSPSMYRQSEVTFYDDANDHPWQCIVIPTVKDTIKAAAGELLPTIPEYLTLQLYGLRENQDRWVLPGAALLRHDGQLEGHLFGNTTLLSLSINRINADPVRSMFAKSYPVVELKRNTA